VATKPTTNELKAHVETDLEAAALTRILDDADAEVRKRFGPHAEDGAITSSKLEGGGRRLYFHRPIASVTSVTEHLGIVSIETTVLATDDWRLEDDGYELLRLPSGTNPRTSWGTHVDVVWTPEDDDGRRTRVIIDLSHLAILYSPLQSERGGDFSGSRKDYEGERESILRRLVDIPGGL